MPEKETLQRARADKRAGKSPTTQAGEFVREEIHHVREGKHGARSAKQAIAIGLSKARRSGVDLPSPPPSATESTKRSARFGAAPGKEQPATVDEACARVTASAQTRTAQHDIAQGAVPSGKERRSPPVAELSLGGSAESGADEKADAGAARSAQIAK
jgi:hypothetical protein